MILQFFLDIGGPLMHIIAAKAAGFFEALNEFQIHIKNVLANAKILAETLKNNGFGNLLWWNRHPLNVGRFKTI